MPLKYPKKGHRRLTKAKARIIGHLIGDGAVYKTNHDYVLKFEVKDEESLTQFYEDIVETYGLIPSREYNVSGKTGNLIPFIRLRSKQAYEDVLRYASYYSYTWKIHAPLTSATAGIKREFLRVLFDDEASIKKDKRIYLYSVNLAGLYQIQNMLLEFTISSKILSGFGEKRNVYALVISNLFLFKKTIGFNLTRKQNYLMHFIHLFNK